MLPILVREAEYLPDARASEGEFVDSGPDAYTLSKNINLRHPQNEARSFADSDTCKMKGRGLSGITSTALFLVDVRVVR